MKTLIMLIMLSLSTAVHCEIAQDKKLHFGGSLVIGTFAQAVTEDLVISSSVCMGVGLTKELYDEYSYGGFDTQDLVADAIGCALGIGGIKAIQIYTDDGDAVGVSYVGKF